MSVEELRSNTAAPGKRPLHTVAWAGTRSSCCSGMCTTALAGAFGRASCRGRLHLVQATP